MGLDILLNIFTVLLIWWSLHGNVLRPWNRLQSVCLHGRLHIWNKRVVRHIIAIMSNALLRQLGEPTENHINLFNHGYAIVVWNSPVTLERTAWNRKSGSKYTLDRNTSSPGIWHQPGLASYFDSTARVMWNHISWEGRLWYLPLSLNGNIAMQTDCYFRFDYHKQNTDGYWPKLLESCWNRDL